MTATSAMPGPGVMSLSDIGLLPWGISIIPSYEDEGQKAGNGEENAIHYAKSKTSFKHSTVFVKIYPEACKGAAQRAEAEIDTSSEGLATDDVRAVRLGNTTKFVDAGNKGAYKAEIDERDKVAMRTRAVVGKEGSDSPGSG